MEEIIKNIQSYEEFNYDRFYKENSYNRKKRIFLEYIDDVFGDLDKRNVLVALNEKNIIASLEHYISLGGQSQRSANSYITYVTQIFEDLSRKYNIKNELFINKDRYAELKESVKPLISMLNEGISKESASDDEYTTMLEAVNKVERTINRDSVIEEVIYKEKGDCFIDLLSVIATRLVLDFGFKNVVLTKIKITDYDVQNNTLWINGMVLPLTSVYRDLMKLYLEARELAVSKTQIKTELLFVNIKGNDFRATSAPDYGALFRIAKNLTKSVSMEKYAYNRIIKMFSMGVDINTIKHLTGFSVDKIFALREEYNDEVVGLNPNVYFSRGAESKESGVNTYEEKKYINCPICNKLVTTEASEWVVVLYEDSQSPVLACKYCGGVYAENNI